MNNWFYKDFVIVLPTSDSTLCASGENRMVIRNIHVIERRAIYDKQPNSSWASA